MVTSERVWTIVGACKRCGAPIMCKTEEMRGMNPPTCYRFCNCKEMADALVAQEGSKGDLLRTM